MQRQLANDDPGSVDSTRRGVTVESVSVSYDGVQRAVDDVSLAVDAGSVVALLGPSGCGKTSLLRAIAGLERPTSGSILIGDRVVSGPSSWVKPERRSIGMVFQDGALFPHLTVADNIAFGLRSRDLRMSSVERHDRVVELLHLVELDGLGDRLPETLSGGQQQRVALARSLAPNPSVLLLDEPFSALDAGLRVQVRSKVARILRDVGVTSIFVTHDQDEAFVLGDRVAVMRDGRVEQYGTPDQLYRAPVTPWVAGFVGEANLVEGTPVGDGLHAVTSLGQIPIADHRSVANGALQILVRPEEISIARDALDGSQAATVVDIEYYGHDVRYELELATGARLAARTHPDVLLSPGEAVHIGYSGGPTSAWPS
jgi:iron(III) transport system ATP-binding protein